MELDTLSVKNLGNIDVLVLLSHFIKCGELHSTYLKCPLAITVKFESIYPCCAVNSRRNIS